MNSTTTDRPENPFVFSGQSSKDIQEPRKISPNPKTGKISSIGLAGFISFKHTGRSIDFYPDPMAMSQPAGGRPLITLGNVPLPPGVPAPLNAITLLYGFRDALDEMKLQYKVAAENGYDVVKVEFNLQINTDSPDTGIVIGTVHEDVLHRSRFLNVLRLDIDMQRSLLDQVNNLMKKESKATGKAAEYFEKINAAGERPDLLCEAIRQNPLYKHLNAVVYSVPNGTQMGRKVCTVFDTTMAVKLVTRGDAPFDVQLPVLKR